MRPTLLNILAFGFAAALSSQVSAEKPLAVDVDHDRQSLPTAVRDTNLKPAQEATPAFEDWPCWRGPAANNHGTGPQPQLEWSANNNVRWKVDVPGRGHGSPCVIGNRIFLPSADEPSNTQFLLCFDRERGELLWRTDLHHGTFPTINEKNSQASATPATDGRIVVVPFANANQLWLSAVDLEGNILWQKIVGDYSHANGYGSSPVLFNKLVIVANDNQLDPAIVALRITDGHTVWRTPRAHSDNSATPIVATVSGRPQLLINGAYAVVSYDPATGEEHWRVTHDTEVAACTMAFDNECVYASGNVPEKLMLCVRADGTGDVTKTHVLWRTHNSNTYVPSPLIDGDLLFLVLDSGVAFCRNARSGKIIWKHRLGGTFFASPVEAGGYVYATNDLGVTYVFRARSVFELVSANDVGEVCMATPAICGGEVFLRTDAHLFCIAMAGGGDKPTSHHD